VTDGQTDGWMDGSLLAIVRSADPCKKCELICCTESNRIVFFSSRPSLVSAILNCNQDFLFMTKVMITCLLPGSPSVTMLVPWLLNTEQVDTIEKADSRCSWWSCCCT